MNLPPESAQWSQAARDAYWERICILSEGRPVTQQMKEIAMKEALEVVAKEKGKP
jgi:hypothetical protein